MSIPFVDPGEITPVETMIEQDYVARRVLREMPPATRRMLDQIFEKVIRGRRAK